MAGLPHVPSITPPKEGVALTAGNCIVSAIRIATCHQRALLFVMAVRRSDDGKLTWYSFFKSGRLFGSHYFVS